jgi:hypothetical protein
VRSFSEYKLDSTLNDPEASPQDTEDSRASVTLGKRSRPFLPHTSSEFPNKP